MGGFQFKRTFAQHYSRRISEPDLTATANPRLAAHTITGHTEHNVAQHSTIRAHPAFSDHPTASRQCRTSTRDQYPIFTLTMRKIDFRAMNCQMMACLDDDSLRAARRLDDVPGWFETWEQRLSRFRPESELNNINQRSSEQVHISAVIDDVLRAARLSQRESGGLVNPLVLPALEAVGYNRSFELIGQESRSVLEIEPKDISTSAHKLHIHRGLLELPLGTRIDLGGVAKGWAADRAAQRLGKLAPALVDAGGDIAVSGAQADGIPWPVGVSDPFHPGQQLDLVLLSRGGVATSGRDYRRWQTGGVEFHHIIDPRTGRPAVTDVLSATVIGPSARAAEAAAKTVLILGSWQGLAWLDERPHLAGLMMLDDGEVLHSRNWIDHIWSENNEPTYDYPIG